MDKQLNERMKAKTYEFANRRFATETIADQYIGLINDSIKI
jgi:hypothetical protein